jgi:hypothetical protein
MMLTHSAAHAFRHIPENPRHRVKRAWNTDRILAAAHCLHTRPADFGDNFTSAPGRTTLPDTLPGGRTMLTSEEAKQAEQAQEALSKRGGRASKLLLPDSSAAPEYWQEYQAELRPGVWFEGVAHTYHAARNLLVMHHPTPVATIDQCAKQLTNRLFVPMALMVMRAMQDTRPEGDAPQMVAFVMQESRFPYDALAIAPSDEWIELGMAQVDDILDMAQECVERDEWPLSERVETLDPPGWAFKMRSNRHEA